MADSWRIVRFPILASTNDLALEWMRSGEAGPRTVLVADEQTSGRGRPGRSWHSPPGSLLITAVLPFGPETAGWTALAAGIAVAEAVESLGADPRLKWPNDVLLDGAKLAGILVETSVPHLAAVGVGMNVRNPRPPDPHLAARTAVLADRLPGVSVESVLEAVLPALDRAWELLAAGDTAALRRDWEMRDATAGRRVRSAAGEGTVLGLAGDGGLLVQTDGGEVLCVRAGEVTFPDGGGPEPPAASTSG